MPLHVRSLAALAAAALATGLAGCGSSSESDDSLIVADAWVKTAESGMTAAFATLTNPTDEDISLTGASTDAAGAVELHEVVDGTMQERPGGFHIPAGERVVLEPGGLHLMLMRLPAPILAGEDVAVTLELSTGDTVEVSAVAKDFDGANEDYDPDAS